MFESTRRRVLQTVGIGGTAAVAGCTSSDTDEAETRRTTVEEADTTQVDQALSRVARKGLMAIIQVRGEQDNDIFDPDPDV